MTCVYEGSGGVLKNVVKEMGSRSAEEEGVEDGLGWSLIRGGHAGINLFGRE